MIVEPNSAAQYVRMSIDMQTNSIEIQSAAIAAYAQNHGFQIIRTYLDAGKSGLSIDGREGLKELIGDVRTGRSNYAHLLIYDVSRWGRFQDPDESAFYEFICRNSGINVHYCAEQFQNDGSLFASIVKNLKRAMAAEFSRELSVKVFAGKARVVSDGFFVGPKAGYGLRRLLVGQDGAPKYELRNGERKGIHADRVILVPGPEDEVETVRRVYDLFVNKGVNMSKIARTLNAEGVTNADGRQWQGEAIHTLLTSEKYIGNSVYNRTSKKLSRNYVRNDPDKWIRFSGAFKPIIPASTFDQARALLRHNACRRSDADLLNTLSSIWCSKGALNIDFLGVNGVPSAKVYADRFGSLLDAYKLVGYRQPFLQGREPNRLLRKKISNCIIDGVQNCGGMVNIVHGPARLRINGEVRVSIAIGRTRRVKNKKQFGICHLGKIRPDIFIIARVIGQDTIKDYFVLPSMFFPKRKWVCISGRSY